MSALDSNPDIRRAVRRAGAELAFAPAEAAAITDVAAHQIALQT
jgi:hypothetical protein